MKLILTILFSIFINSTLTCYADEFDITPIKFNFNGVEVHDNIVVAYGENASILISKDTGKTWEQKKIFKRGDIVKLFIDGTNIIAFNEEGNINISSDTARTWDNIQNINDTIVSAVKFQGGYFIRGRNKIFALDNNYQVKHNFNLYSKELDVSLPIKYTNSITNFNDQLIVSTDSARFLRFNKELELIDTLSFPDLSLCTHCSSYYQIGSDNYYIYILNEGKMYATEDFKKVEKMFDCNLYFFMFKIINNKFYALEYSPEYYEMGLFNFKIIELNGINSFKTTSDITGYTKTGTIYIRDFCINNNDVAIVGLGKFIATNKINDSILNTKSDLTDITRAVLPDKINDSSFIFYHGFSNGAYFPTIYKSENFGLTALPLQKMTVDNEERRDAYFMFKHFNDVTKEIFFWGVNRNSQKPKEQGIFISRDTGKIFNYKEISEFNFNIDIFLNIRNYPNFCVTPDYYVLTARTLYGNYINTKCFFDHEFNLVSKQIDSNYIIEFIDVIDTNKYLVKCLDTKDTLYQIKTTTDKGANWDIIKVYHKADSMMHSKELVLNNEKYLSIFYYNTEDSIVTLDFLNLIKRTVTTVQLHKLNTSDNSITIKYYAVDCYNDTIYICALDTMFYTLDLSIIKNRDYYIFPDNGKVYQTFKRYGDKFYARYQDTNNPETIYWLKPIKKNVPTPVLSINNIDFGQHDISDSNYPVKKVKILNQSLNADLKVFNISQLSTYFQSDNIKPDSLTPLIIKPNSLYEFNVTFRPTSSGVFDDSIIVLSNATQSKYVCYLTGEATDTIKSSIEVITETEPYLYISNPYPNPGNLIIRIPCFWDKELMISPKDLSINSLLGYRISKNDEFDIEQLSDIRGIVSWNCSAYPCGVYLFSIKYGDLIKSKPIVIAK